MRIFDIINEGPLPAITNPDELDVYANMGNGRQGVWKGDDGFERIGGGIEAEVYQTPTDPDILKVMAARQKLKNNPYLQYVLMSKRHAHENPYLPRIISIHTAGSADIINKLSHKKEKSDVYVVKMEPLVELDRLSSSELEVIYEYAFGTPYESGFDASYIARRISNLARLGKANWGKFPSVNPLLLAVIGLIIKIKNQVPGAYYDMHAGNIMARRTPYGAQLVITDPLYTNDDHIRSGS